MSNTLTSNDEYENFVDAHIEPAEEYIPTKLTAIHNSLETLVVRKNEKT